MMDLDHYPHVHKPYEHQDRIWRKSWDKQGHGLFMEMGTGKSKIVIDTLAMLYLNRKIDGVVIIAKKGEYANWHYDQLPTHMPEVVPWTSYLFSTTVHRRVKSKRDFGKLLTTQDGLPILVINIEALGTTVATQAMDMFYSERKRIALILDESTCAKNPKSKRSKEVYYYAAKSHYRRIMTGTAVAESPLDLFGQSMVLGKGITGHKSFYSFRGMYAEMEDLYINGRIIKKVAGYKNMDAFERLIRMIGDVVHKEECLDLPDKIYSKVAVPMTPSQERLYNELATAAMAQFEGVNFDITNAMALMTKLHQVCTGHIIDEEGNGIRVENTRKEALIDILEAHQGKAIIWGTYRQNLKEIVETISERFGPESVVAYYGGVGDKDRQAAIEQFQDPNSPVRFFVANPQSAGFGITLVQATLMVYYSNSFRLETRLQSEDRAHRIGQTENLHIVDMYCPGTVEDKIIEALRTKKRLSDMVMNNPNIENWI